MVKNTDEQLEHIRELMDKLYEITDGISGCFDTIEENFSKEEAVKKMKKKEREAYLKAAAAEKFPLLVKEIKGLNLAIEGLAVWLEDTKDELERQQDILDDIDQLKDEIEDKKRELDD